MASSKRGLSPQPQESRKRSFRKSTQDIAKRVGYYDEISHGELEMATSVHEDPKFNADLAKSCAFPSLPLDYPGLGPSEKVAAEQKAAEALPGASKERPSPPAPGNQNAAFPYIPTTVAERKRSADNFRRWVEIQTSLNLSSSDDDEIRFARYRYPNQFLHRQCLKVLESVGVRVEKPDYGIFKYYFEPAPNYNHFVNGCLSKEHHPKFLATYGPVIRTTLHAEDAKGRYSYLQCVRLEHLKSITSQEIEAMPDRAPDDARNGLTYRLRQPPRPDPDPRKVLKLACYRDFLWSHRDGSSVFGARATKALPKVETSEGLDVNWEDWIDEAMWDHGEAEECRSDGSNEHTVPEPCHDDDNIYD